MKRKMQDECGKYVKQMRHCQRCRADAIGNSATTSSRACMKRSNDYPFFSDVTVKSFLSCHLINVFTRFPFLVQFLSLPGIISERILSSPGLPTAIVNRGIVSLFRTAWLGRDLSVGRGFCLFSEIVQFIDHRSKQGRRRRVLGIHRFAVVTDGIVE